ncbi:hypothetical protein [Lacipirellula parvula]|nr:hypothetical protein [Lacipirellula parvula]
MRVALAATAIVAVIAWQWSIVYQRRAFLSDARGLTLSEIYWMNSNWADGHHKPQFAPGYFRLLLGDDSYGVVLLQRNCSDGLVAKGQALFPEALVEQEPHRW